MKKLLSKVVLSSLILLSACSKFEFVAGDPKNDFFNTSGFVDGISSIARFDTPISMAVDERNGNLYVLDQSEGNVIRKIDLNKNVSTFFRISNEFKNNTPFSRDCIRINGNYLYFSDSGYIKRINLDSSSPLPEIFIGSGNIGEKDGDFKNTEFFHLDSFIFYSDGNMFIDDGKRIKFADVKTQKTKNIAIYDYTIQEKRVEVLTSFRELTLNTTNQSIYTTAFLGIFSSNLVLEVTKDYDIIYHNENESSLSALVKSISSFIYDDKGNLYIISNDKEQLLKYDTNKNISYLSNFFGVFKLEAPGPDSDFRVVSSNLAIDNKRNILYVSIPAQNNIYKINLK